ncbi:hypothetical protein O0L34_g16533 [Tuta absoluta]|nr:hypothetical protein O0L34_g16533 [Tuta absoluta]
MFFKLSFALVLVVVGSAVADFDFSFGQKCPVGQTWGCGDNCNRECRIYLKPPSPFVLSLRCAGIQCTEDVSSCQCDPQQGYWYSEKNKTCVQAADCALYP